MRSQACEPCAKRKVRCDREEPCSNCKRRKQDRCDYPELSPTDRIKKLEELVRALGGSPDDDVTVHGRAHTTGSSPTVPAKQSAHESQGPLSLTETRSKDPVILEDDGQQYYLESRAWLVHGHRQSGARTANAKNPLLLRTAPPAFQNIICSRRSLSLTTPNISCDKAQILWTIFKQRVHPFSKLSFSWDLERLESASISSAYPTNLDDAQYALVCSIYWASIISLTDDECRTKLYQSKSSLLSEYQALCEEALASTNILCMKNIVALKAMAIYLLVSLDRLSTQSLWTMMGLAIRNGEKLGIHRDGTLLGLSPAETEERRRLWWNLQYLDLILAVRLGVTPLTLMADWDVKLPLNIEDNDLSPDMNSFPEERKGLTSMSYCMFTYYVLDQQRRYHADKGRFELSWSTNQSVPIQVKEAFVDQLEDGLNKGFLQYCDPIQPLHILLQLIARALICVFRQRILLTDGEDPGHMDQEHHSRLLASSMHLLEYAVVIHSHRRLKDFEWLTANGFPWPACRCLTFLHAAKLTSLVMIVLVEASHQTDEDKCQRIWTLLSDLYEASVSLLELAEDRRRLHAAELIVSAWKTCQRKGTVGRSSPKPDFVSSLEKRLVECIAESTQTSVAKEVNRDEQGDLVGLDTPQSLLGERNATALFDMELEDIDWSFWNSID